MTTTPKALRQELLDIPVPEPRDRAARDLKARLKSVLGVDAQPGGDSIVIDGIGLWLDFDGRLIAYIPGFGYFRTMSRTHLAMMLRRSMLGGKP